MRYLLYSVTFVVTILLTSCSGPKNILVEPSTTTFVNPSPEVPTSTVSIPISIFFSALEKEINAAFQGVLYEDDSFEGDNLLVRVTKAGAFQIIGYGDSLMITAPVHIWAKGRYVPGGITALTVEKDISLKPIVTLSTRMKIRTDWGLETKTTPHIAWQESPVLEVGPLKIPIRRVLDAVLERQLNRIGSEVDKAIADQLELRKEIESAWKTVQMPMELDKERGAYLVLTPSALAVQPFRADGRAMHTGAVMQTKARIVTGLTAPPVVASPTPLPKASSKLGDAKGFQVVFSVAIPYPQLAKEMQQAFADEPFDFPDVSRRLLIDTWSFSPRGERIQVGLDFRVLKLNKSGKVLEGKKPWKGHVFLTAKPVIDMATKTMSFSDIQFELKSKNALLGAAAWMLNGRLEKAMAAEKFEFGSYLIEYKKMADQMLQGYPIGGGLEVRGNLKQLDILEALPTQEGLIIYIKSIGILEVKN